MGGPPSRNWSYRAILSPNPMFLSVNGKPSIPERLGIQDDDFRLVIGRTKVDYDPDKEDANRKNTAIPSGVPWI